MTWGLLRPVMLLPTEAEDWPAERRRAVLLHELAHMKRWDYLTQTIGWLACALHWLNPLAWFALRRMRVERELACDDYVLNAGLRPSTYAQHLLEIARGLRGPCCVGAVAMARSSGLEGRVRAILQVTGSRAAMTRLGLCVTLVLALSVVLPLSALRPVASAERSRLRRDPELPGDYVTFIAKGRVVRPDGQPAAKAKVYLYRDFMGYHGAEASGLRGETVCGPDGSFELGGVRCYPADATHYFRYDRIVAVAEGFGAAIWSAAKGANAEPAITLELPEEADLRGTVIDEDGRPVAGAMVRPYALRFQFGSKGWASAYLGGETFGPLVVTTGRDGRFAMRYIPQAREARLRLSVRHAKFAEACRAIDLHREEDDLTIKLGAGGVIEGRVIHDGAVSAEVSASCYTLDGQLARTVATDARGR